MTFKQQRSSPITLQQIDGEKMETGRDIIFLGSKITAYGDFSHEIKRDFLLGRKAVTNLDCILKSRDVTLPSKFCLVKAMVFPVVMYGCESWTIKKAEHQRLDAFELHCWKRLLRIPWTARRKTYIFMISKFKTTFTAVYVHSKMKRFFHIIPLACIASPLSRVYI